MNSIGSKYLKYIDTINNHMYILWLPYAMVILTITLISI